MSTRRRYTDPTKFSRLVTDGASYAIGDGTSAKITPPRIPDEELIMWEMLTEYDLLIEQTSDMLWDGRFAEWLDSISMEDDNGDRVLFSPDWLDTPERRQTFREIVDVMLKVQEFAVSAHREISKAFPILMDAIGVPAHHGSHLRNSIIMSDDKDLPLLFSDIHLEEYGEEQENLPE